MKGLKKVALASAIAAVSAGAQAELKALDDAAMGELTGQAGITIDVETKYTIGEFAYVDAGALIIGGISMGGNTDAAGGTAYLDNFRMTIDLAGAGDGTPLGDNVLHNGMSEVINLAAFHVLANNTDGDMIEAADAALTLLGHPSAGDGVSRHSDGFVIDGKKAYGDGDLKIHFGFTDAWEKGGGFAAYAAGAGSDGNGGVTDFENFQYDAAVDIASRAVDFEFGIDVIGLAASSYVTDGRLGNAATAVQATDHATGLDADTTDTTALISDLSMKGYLGPADLHIQNNGNGFAGGQLAALGITGTGAADSKILWDSYFKVTDLELYIDIAGVQLSEIEIHNERGDLTGLNQVVVGVDPATGAPIYENTSSIGFAHSKREIYAVKDDVLHVESFDGVDIMTAFEDGIALNTEFKGDIDIGHLSFGDTGKSIGEIYLTDVYSDTNWTISAH